MDVIEEKGVIYVVSREQSANVDTKGLWVPIGLRPLYYSKVVWIDSLKFVFGCWDSGKDKIEVMVEVSTGGVAASQDDFTGQRGKITVERLIKKYQEKLVRHRAACGEQVVENFKQRFTIQLWQINFWALQGGLSL